jgi:hypothetical protein
LPEKEHANIPVFSNLMKTDQTMLRWSKSIRGVTRNIS